MHGSTLSTSTNGRWLCAATTRTGSAPAGGSRPRAPPRSPGARPPARTGAAARPGAGGRTRALRPDQIAEDAPYDEIWSNPPIRIGKQALHELLQTWLARLTPEGVAYLVVGKNLGADTLAGWLISAGYDCARLASAKGFRVLEVRPRD